MEDCGLGQWGLEDLQGKVLKSLEILLYGKGKKESGVSISRALKKILIKYERLKHCRL